MEYILQRNARNSRNVKDIDIIFLNNRYIHYGCEMRRRSDNNICRNLSCNNSAPYNEFCSKSFYIETHGE